MKEFEKIPSLFGVNVFNETAMATSPATPW